MPVFDRWAPLLAVLRDPGSKFRYEQLMPSVLDLSRDVAEGCIGCSVTEIDGAGYRTPAASSPLAEELDFAQYAAASGPCVRAVRDRQIQQVAVIGADDQWPDFAEAADQRAVRSSLSYPVSGTSRPTALNLYSTVEAAFGSARSLAVAGLLARCVGRLSSAGYGDEIVDDTDAQAARTKGRRVSAAVEHLMRRRELTRSDAFAELAHRGRDEQTGIALTAERELTEGGSSS